MSNVYDILCVIDCDQPFARNVKMYSGTESIVQSGEGGNELAVRVPGDSVLRWRAVPLQLQSDRGGSNEYYHCIISKVHLWGNAREYITGWEANKGEGGAPVYAHNDNISPEHEISLDTVGRYRPYVQATAVLPGRDDNESPQVAYTFYVKIYQGETLVKEMSWDPYVTVYRD